MSISPISFYPGNSYTAPYQPSHPVSFHETTAAAAVRQAPPSPVKQQPPTAEPSDTVYISQQAQAQRLLGEGETPTEIANSLGVSISLVDSDLGITQAASSPAAAALKAAPVSV